MLERENAEGVANVPFVYERSGVLDRRTRRDFALLVGTSSCCASDEATAARREMMAAVVFKGAGLTSVTLVERLDARCLVARFLQEFARGGAGLASSSPSMTPPVYERERVDADPVLPDEYELAVFGDRHHVHPVAARGNDPAAFARCRARRLAWCAPTRNTP